MTFFIASLVNSANANFWWHKSSFSTHELTDINANIFSLNELPILIKQILEKEKILENYQIVIFVDFEDTIAQRTFMIKSATGVEYPFRYLSSFEIERTMESSIDSLIKIIVPNDPGKQKLLHDAKNYVVSIFNDSQPTYYCPEARESLIKLDQQLKEMRAVVKICSRRPLDTSRKAFIEYLGFQQEDYIYTPDKAEALAKHVVEDSRNNSHSSKTYIAVYVDNYPQDKIVNPFISQLTLYNALSNNYRGKLLSNHRVINVTVEDKRFINEVFKQQAAIKREIGFALKLYKEFGKNLLSVPYNEKKQQLQQQFTQNLAAIEKAQAEEEANLNQLYNSPKIFE